MNWRNLAGAWRTLAGAPQNIFWGVTVRGEQSRWFTLLPALEIHPENKEKWQVLGKSSTNKIEIYLKGIGKLLKAT